MGKDSDAQEAVPHAPEDTWQARSPELGMRRGLSSLLSVWPGESHITSLNPNFLIHEMELILATLFTALSKEPNEVGEQ